MGHVEGMGDVEATAPRALADGMDLGATLRALRRRADLSQRELAARAGVPKSTVSRIEAGTAPNPSFRAVERLARAAGAALTVGRAEPEAVPHEALRDRAGRHYPAHLDIIEVTRPEQWWGAWWTLTMIESRWPLETVPPYTYDGNRERRDRRRERMARGAGVRIERLGVPGLAGHGWVWLAHAGADGGAREPRRVGELRAHRDVDPHGGSSGSGVMLDGVVVAPAWRGCGVGRRLVEALRAHVPGERVTALAIGFGADRFLRACGFARWGVGASRWSIPPAGS